MIHPDLSFELELWQRGASRIAGIDEAGRGAWAGPVSAAAVILPLEPALLLRLHGVRDSKQMSPEQREAWACVIRQAALDWSVGFATNYEVDTLGLLVATRMAMQRALLRLTYPPQHLLIDAVRLPLDTPQTCIIKGDARCLSIAAASVLAKTARDALMRDLDRTFPGYEFSRHKGYGTRLHQEALLSLGPSPIHRMSYTPIRNLVEYGVLTTDLDTDCTD
jgi:ribonuclease HII